MWTFFLPGYLPVSLNKLLRCHWGQRQRHQRQAAELVGLHGRVLGKVPEAQGKRRVHLKLILPPTHKVKPDEDNLWKQLLDSLVKSRLLVDDSPAWCEIGSYTVERGSRTDFGTVLTLEDVGS